MEVSKLMIAHIATEVVVIGGISFFFHKRIVELNTKIAELEKKLEKAEGCKCTSSEGGSTGEAFQQQTTQHINNIYSIIRQITNNINESPQQEHEPSRVKPKTKESLARDSQKEMKKKILEVHSHSNDQTTPLSSLSLTPENTNGNGQTKLELIDDDEKTGIHEEDLDNEIEDELRDMSDKSRSNDDDDEKSIKNEETNTSLQETPLEFIPTKGKKLVKKKIGK